MINRKARVPLALIVFFGVIWIYHYSVMHAAFENDEARPSFTRVQTLPGREAGRGGARDSVLRAAPGVRSRKGEPCPVCPSCDSEKRAAVAAGRNDVSLQLEEVGGNTNSNSNNNNGAGAGVGGGPSRSSGDAPVAGALTGSPASRFGSLRTPMGADDRFCDDNFGLGLVRRWRDAHVEVCSPGNGALPSRVRCGKITQGNHGGPDTLCEVTNLRVDTRKITVSKGGEEIDSVRGRTDGEETVAMQSGAIYGDCANTPGTPGVSPNEMQYITKDIFRSWTTSPSAECARTIRGTSLIVTRYEYANWYHVATDFINTFLAMEIHEVDPDDATVVIFDGHPWSPFDGFWNKVFAPKTKLEWIGQMDGTVCFERAIFVNTGYQSPLATQWGEPNTCFDAPLFQSFSQRVMEAYGLLDTPAPVKPTVTFVFREDYIAHPREKDGKRRNKIANEKDLVDLVEGGDDIEVRAVNMAKLSFQEQLQVVRSTNVLVGMHGAGLTHTLFLPKEAVLVELFPIHVTSKKHFRNIARWMGHTYIPYRNLDSKNELDPFTTRHNVDALKPALDAAVRVARNFAKRNQYCGINCAGGD